MFVVEEHYPESESESGSVSGSRVQKRTCEESTSHYAVTTVAYTTLYTPSSMMLQKK